VGTGFPKRSCSNKKIERDDDSKKSHPALALTSDTAPKTSAQTAPAALMFGDNASGRRGRSGSCSAVHNGPFTVDVAFELNNRELLITDDAFDKIAD
jgi:hypothetical protein